MNRFISKHLELKTPILKVEEIELKGERCKYFYAKISYTPDCCGTLNTNHTIVKIVVFISQPKQTSLMLLSYF